MGQTARQVRRPLRHLLAAPDAAATVCGLAPPPLPHALVTRHPQLADSPSTCRACAAAWQAGPAAGS